MALTKALCNKIDKIITKVDAKAINPAFSKEIMDRKRRRVPDRITEKKLLETFVRLIAFSGLTPSNKVKELLETHLFDKIFHGYDVKRVARLNPCDIVDQYWEDICCIRYQSKIFQVVMFARRIDRIGSLARLMIQADMPVRIRSMKDIEKFWEAFERLQADLKELKVSYLKETTTLLHFLLETGYDCVKPDLIVMRVAEKLHMIGSGKMDEKLKQTVRSIQEYAVLRQIRPSLVDLYFLIDEGQKDARMLVNSTYYGKKRIEG